MAFDLAISSLGDLIISGYRDLMGKSGQALIEQRMIIRLKIPRGSWVYDDDGSLGSQLYTLTSMTPTQAQAVAPAMVREALREMTEISVDDVRISFDVRSMTIIVYYHIVQTEGAGVQVGFEQVQELSFTIPLTGGNA